MKANYKFKIFETVIPEIEELLMFKLLNQATLIFFLTLAYIMAIPLVSVAQINLLDINPTGNSNPSHFFNLNGKIIFLADDGAHGQELWATDGTGSGTQLIKDIYIGSNSGIVGKESFQVIGNTLYFIGNDGVSGAELWKTDGTTAGTVIVKDIFPGSTDGIILSQTGGSEFQFIEFNGLLYFIAKEGTGTSPNNVVLWRSDGIIGGTIPVFTGPSIKTPEFLAKSSNAIYFSALGTQPSLFKYDGVSTSLVTAGVSMPQFNLSDGSFIYFEIGPIAGGSLWRTDGTNVGTVKVKDLSYPAPVEYSNGILFFSDGYQLWRSDGTDAGTFEIEQTAYVIEKPNSINIRRIISYNNYVYYTNYVGGVNPHYEVHRTDGSLVGTQKFIDNVNGENFKVLNTQI